jgi:K+-transporting ATPase ATPase C chain
VTASGSGLDPEVTPAAAAAQMARVVKARGLSKDALSSLIRTHTRGRVLGILGEPGVNVLELNLALDSLPPRDRSDVPSHTEVQN